MDLPETRYARSGDVNIAYQVVGDGPFDVVLIPPSVSHVEFGWTTPRQARLRRGLAEGSRLIFFDKRGTGMSDRLDRATTFEQRMDDIRAVMDAAGSERAALVGMSEGAPMAVLFAATYPARAAALVLYGGLARTLWAPDFPLGMPRQEYEQALAEETASWTKPGYLEQSVRELLGDASATEVEGMINVFRYGATPGAMVDLDTLNASIDVRPALPAIRVPTLVIHQNGDPAVPIGHGRYLAEHIAGARLVELEGVSHGLSESQLEPFLEETHAFLGEVGSGEWRAPEPDRVLATVLFTDIVGSTARAAELGDRAWRELMERHHAAIRSELSRFRGVEHDTAGDGFFASFDGPARAIQCAGAIRDRVRDLDIDIRAGLHTGECELLDDKVAGIAVAIGARVAAQAAPGEVLVSQTVKDLVAGSGLAFEDRGAADLKGVPGEWRLYAVAAC